METAATSRGNPASSDPNTRASTISAPRPPSSTSNRMLRSPPPPSASTVKPLRVTVVPPVVACFATCSRRGVAAAYGSGPGVSGG